MSNSFHRLSNHDPPPTGAVREGGAALTELYKRYHPRLFRYCRRLLHDVECAEDVMQELWERVLRLGAEGKELPANPAALLLTIARNLCLDDLRRVHPHRLTEVPEEHLPMSEMREYSRVEELLALALPQLKPLHREVLGLTLAGYSVEEIAGMIGKPRGAIKMMAMRARARLHDLIVDALDRENAIMELAERRQRGNR